MNRVLSIFALLLSLGAFLVSLLLWREVRALRPETSQHPIHARLSDNEFSLIQGFNDYVHATFAETHLPRGEVLLADQLLNKARYMHGDISQEEWLRLNLSAPADFSELLIARFKAGAGSSADIMNHYDDLLESSR